jgi:hypothetical protein
MQEKRHPQSEVFLELIDKSRKPFTCLNGHVLFSMGNFDDSVYYIELGPSNRYLGNRVVSE